MRMATAGRPGASTSKVFRNGNFHTRQKFVNTDHRLRQTGTFQVVAENWRRPLSIQTPNLDRDMLHHIEQDPASSTRMIAAVEHVSHMIVGKLQHRQLLYPYHLRRVQGLGPADLSAREGFC
jgi:hypothetical protein